MMLNYHSQDHECDQEGADDKPCQEWDERPVGIEWE